MQKLTVAPEEVAGFGACCKSGLACGKGFCYSTSYPTQTLVLTSVFRDSNQDLTTTTATITTAYQPSSIPTIATTVGPTRIVVTETAIPKIAAVDTTPNTGMSKGTMNGIIAGAVVALVLIMLVGWFIIRRLNYLARMRELPAYANVDPGHKHNLSGDSANSNLSRVGGEITAVDSPGPPFGAFQGNISVDPPFIASGSTTPRRPRPSMSHGNSSDTDIYGSPPPPIPAPYVWNQGYAQVSNNEGSYFAHSKHTSMDSNGGVGTYSPAYGGHASEVNRESYLTDQNLRFGHDTSTRQSLASTHGRQWSDASDVSNNSNNSGRATSELDGRRVSVGSSTTETGNNPRGGVGGRPSGERRARSWTIIPAGGRRNSSGAGSTLPTLYGGPSAPLSGGGRLEGVAEAETDASQSTGLLGMVRKKGDRPRASTKNSDASSVTARGPQSRSASEGHIPQIMYTNQAESRSLPIVPDSPPVARAVPQFAGPLSAHPTMHSPVEFSSRDILVTTTTETSTERTGQHTQGSATEAEYERAKKEVLVRTREVDLREP